MDKIFFSGALKNFIRRRVFITDSPVLRLHYQLTALLLTVGSLLVSTTQFIGDPINCIQTDDVPTKLLNTYCWVEGTFSLPRALNSKVGEEVVYPGVDNKEPGDDTVLHAYYQWVCFTLLFQAALFYFPRLLWSSWEGGRMKNLLQELHRPVVPDDEKKKKFGYLVHYFRCNMRHHSSYSFRYALCEVIALVNVICQIYFVDLFLGGEFTTYGLEVVSFAISEQVDRVDPMVKVFPRLTKCLFHRFGPSGTVQKYDALCLLPLNIVNEKIYIVLWFWLIILSALTALVVAYRVVLMGWPRLRYLDLHTMARLTPKEDLRRILDKISYGDWFVLSLLARNMEILNFKDFLIELNRGLDSPHECKDNGDAFSSA